MRDCKREMTNEQLLEAHCNLMAEYARLKAKSGAMEEQMKELRKENRELEKQNDDIRNSHKKFYDDVEKEISRLEEENAKLKEEIHKLTEKQCEDCSCERSITFSDSGPNVDNLLRELQDNKQQDCIRINDLTTTINVLTRLYSNLRKNVGMD